MARTVSIMDDETGITASMKVVDDGDEQRTVQLTLTAVEGVGIVGKDLLMLAQLGVKLPFVEPVAIPAPPRQRAAPAAKAPGKTASGKTASRRRFTGKVPTGDELLALWRSMGGSAVKCAEHYGVSDSTVRNWIARARAAGTEFTLLATIPEQQGASR